MESVRKKRRAPLPPPLRQSISKEAARAQNEHSVLGGKSAGARIGLLRNVGCRLGALRHCALSSVQRFERASRRVRPFSDAHDPMKLRKACLLLVGSVGALLLIGGSIILGILPNFVRNGVLEAISLSNGSKAEKGWIDPPYEMSMQVWFFNITNPDEVMLYQAKPSLVEMGPYGFDERQHKVAVTYYDNGTIGYQNFKWFQFNASKSCDHCRLSDVVNVPNVPFWSLLHKLRRSGSMPKLKKFISYGLLGVGEGAFITKSVDALLFTGYNDIIFAMAKMFHWLSPDTKVPDRMGFMYGKNWTLDGAYLMNSGQANYLERGRLELYKGRSSVDAWVDVWSNMINGSDGTVYPPFLERTSRLPLFSPDLCRSLYMDYLKDVRSGELNAYRFTVPAEVFDDKRAENAGFCWPTDVYYPEIQKVEYSTGLACLPSGLLNVSKCQMDAPIVLSSPHFLYASDVVQNSVFGLRPNVEEHTTRIDIEPVSSVGLEFQRKLQINVGMVQDGDFSTLKRMRSVIMPVLWLNESAYLNAEARRDIWQRLFLPRLVAKIVGSALITTGVISILLAIGLFFFYRRIQEKQETI
uniref:CD36 family protein n=1 Tax=Trichuris muris TaxID=70415 RepID=A0A5S6QSW8_TRIMR